LPCKRTSPIAIKLRCQVAAKATQRIERGHKRISAHNSARPLAEHILEPCLCPGCAGVYAWVHPFAQANALILVVIQAQNAPAIRREVAQVAILTGRLRRRQMFAKSQLDAADAAGQQVHIAEGRPLDEFIVVGQNRDRNVVDGNLPIAEQATQQLITEPARLERL